MEDKYEQTFKARRRPEKVLLLRWIKLKLEIICSVYYLCLYASLINQNLGKVVGKGRESFIVTHGRRGKIPSQPWEIFSWESK